MHSFIAAIERDIDNSTIQTVLLEKPYRNHEIDPRYQNQQKEELVEIYKTH